jgi:hypothetical protein
MEKIQFNHDVRTMSQALCIPDERRHYLHAVVLFNMVYQSIMVHSLFDEPDEAPINMRTKSGCLEKMLEAAETEAERLYIVWEYCSVDIKTDDGPSGAMFLSMISAKSKDLDLDQDAFCQWWVKHRMEAETEADD